MERLSKEDYALVEELREQVAIAQCEENVRGKVILQSQGKEFFTWHGKDFFT